MGLQLEGTIPLGDVRGRIDHMAADPDRHRLFVAELGTPMRERLALLEGKVAVLLGGEAVTSSTRSKRAKQAPVDGNGRLLEHRSQ